MKDEDEDEEFEKTESLLSTGWIPSTESFLPFLVCVPFASVSLLSSGGNATS
jgi:hypothetical protein